MNKATVRNLVAASALAFASASQAAVISEFNYSLSLEWVDADFKAATNTLGDYDAKHDSGGAVSLDGKEIWWGTKDADRIDNTKKTMARSSLVITNSPVAGSISTDGSVVATNIFTHYNSTIHEDSVKLEMAKLAVTIQLSAPGFGSRQMTEYFDMYFIETPNTGTQGCTYGPCYDDIFAIVASDPQLDNFTRSYTFAGQEYSFRYFETTDNLNALSTAACTRAGIVGADCYGFTTAEGKNTPVQFGFSVTAVPEPETYAMLLAGLGLIAGVVRRRRNAMM